MFSNRGVWLDFVLPANAIRQLGYYRNSVHLLTTPRSGDAVFAAQEFFFGSIRHEHTRRAYLHAVKLFMASIEKHGGGGAGTDRSLACGQVF